MDNIAEWQTAVMAALKQRKADTLREDWEMHELVESLETEQEAAFLLAGWVTLTNAGIQLNNKTTLRMQRDRATIIKAKAELGREGDTQTHLQKRAWEACCANEIPNTQGWEEWKTGDIDTNLELLRKADRHMYKSHKVTITKMHSEQIRYFLALCRANMEKGGEGEIQRFLQKTAP
eukprot:992961-Rhodomonas_salina.3